MMINVLFIGNSHTYLNYMPRMLTALVDAEDRGFKLKAEQSAGKGVNLEWHWNNPTTREIIATGRWNYVVLQDRSGGPLEALESFQRHSRMLDAEIKKQSAKTVLYMTWANRSRPETQALLADAYANMARKLNATVAPVGLAWEQVQRVNPDLDLYHRDGRHANPVGSYLAACVFYSAILNISPEGLPGAISIDDKVRVNLDQDTTRCLQKIAFDKVKNTE
ncbi:MAG: hypothetical protein PVG70_19625 [Desulfobacterales bacterium]|jgi:hypothetical protein